MLRKHVTNYKTFHLVKRSFPFSIFFAPFGESFRKIMVILAGFVLLLLH